MTGPGTNTLNGAEAMVRMLQLHGVRQIFGLCGDTSLPIYDALHRLDHGMTHILTRDERSAAVAASYGMKSWRVERPGDLKPALSKAFEWGEQALVDIITQPLHEAAAPVGEWVA